MSMKIICATLIVLCCVFDAALIAQSNPTLVNLLTKLQLAEHDTTRMDLHIHLADVYIAQEANAESALDHANLALILAENNNDKRRQLLSLDKLIKVFYEVKLDI